MHFSSQVSEQALHLVVQITYRCSGHKAQNKHGSEFTYWKINLSPN